MVTIIVRARPMRSPSTPNTSPPVAQPVMKMVVALPLAVARVARMPSAVFASAPAGMGSRSSIAAGRASTKSCWSIVSKSQPMAATASTNQW